VIHFFLKQKYASTDGENAQMRGPGYPSGSKSLIIEISNIALDISMQIP
jgi:hypothetical protein